jgi:hypothetical protein
MINRVKGYEEEVRGTGDGRVRSESWHVFWIGSERLSEMEYVRVCVDGLNISFV